MDFKCTCLNSGTNSFTGHCDRCGMVKPLNGTIMNINTEEKVNVLTPLGTIQIPKKELPAMASKLLQQVILELPRYNNYSLHDNPCMVKNKDGKYIKLEDVLSLFSREKKNS